MSIEQIREHIEVQIEALQIEWRKADEVMNDEQRREWRAGITHSLNQLQELFKRLDEARNA
tara:strand:+ start:1981 stop:2163 length:183 start_codon:yes stop_codon:yes gene_type:complete